MKVAFFEPRISGHRLEYIQHLLDYIRDLNTSDLFTFIIHPEANKSLNIPKSRNILICNILTEEAEELNSGYRIKRSIKYYRLADKYLKNSQIEFLFYLSMVEVQIALILFRPAYQVSGILFRVHIFRKLKGIKKILIWTGKSVLAWILVKRKFVRHAFILNDMTVVQELNKFFRSEKFMVLPDPILVLEPDSKMDIRSHFSIEKNRKIFLHPGSLDSRKGTMNILKSMFILDRAELNQIALILIGKPMGNSDEEIAYLIGGIKKKKLPVQIIYHPFFIDKGFFQACMLQADYILAPYCNENLTYSGIVGHALISRKPVISIRGGYLGNIIEEKKQGILIENNDPKNISAAIVRIFKIQNKLPIPLSFFQWHSGPSFAKSILEGFSI